MPRPVTNSDPLLLAVDFSPASRLALDACARLAPRLRAPVVLLHAGSGGKDPGGHANRLKAQTWVRILRSSGIEAEALVRPGPPADAILAEAEGRGASLVVLGTAGETGLRGFILGSVTQAVLRRSRLPVLLAPLRARGGAGEPSGPVVAAVDFSDQSAATVKAAAGMAKALRRPLRLVHVVDVFPYASAAAGAATAGIPADLLEKDEREARAGLRRLARQAARAGVKVEEAVQFGQPASSILADAAAVGASLVAVGTHGRSRLRHLLLGSVAQQVVHGADRPVLVVPRLQ